MQSSAGGGYEAMYNIEILFVISGELLMAAAVFFLPNHPTPDTLRPVLATSLSLRWYKEFNQE